MDRAPAWLRVASVALCAWLMLAAPARAQAPVCLTLDDPPSGARGVSSFGSSWKNGQVLRIKFLDGTPAMHRQVARVAREWTQYANLTFEFSQTGESDIRITFRNKGYYSMVGSVSRGVPQTRPTMNLGPGFTDGTILHEFGHAIGLEHEHQNPQAGIVWNEEAVIKTFGGPPNNWPREKVVFNITQRLGRDRVRSTAFDPDSIMLYAFPASLTKNGVGTRENERLSQQDRAFVATLYPGAKPGGGQPAAKSLASTLGSSLNFTVSRVGAQWRVACVTRTALRSISQVTYLLNASDVLRLALPVSRDRENNFAVTTSSLGGEMFHTRTRFTDGSIHDAKHRVRAN